MAITTDTLRAGVARIGTRLETEHQGLTQLDGQVGDGDLGLTLLKAFRAMAEIKDGLPADLGLALLQLGQATSKVSSSSFGTLMATGLLADAKLLKGRESAEWRELSDLVRMAREAMQARGKAELGDKTVLDALAAIEPAVAQLANPVVQLAAARVAAGKALDEFRGKPNRIGRARVYGDKTVGIDDPGMVAVKVMLEGL